MNRDEMEKMIMSIITTAGNGRSLAHEAFDAAMRKEFDDAENLLKQSNEELEKVHEIQASLIQKEARGEGEPPTLLMVHAQDILMSAISEKELIEKMIGMYKALVLGGE